MQKAQLCLGHSQSHAKGPSGMSVRGIASRDFHEEMAKST